MEQNKFKLCLKNLPNSHMKSNLLNLPIHPKVEEEQSDVPLPPSQLSQKFEPASYSSSSSSEREEKGQFYGLRENPRRSIRSVDPEFVDANSVVLQSRESETESSKNPTRRRSKRTWRTLEQHEETKKLKVNTNQPSPTPTESWEAEPEPVSSISDTTTTEEDIAFCLMMLSRDQWKSRVHQDDDDEEDESEEYFKLRNVNRTTRGKYRCETCNKVFNSYQALGGHRASHKKIKANETENVGTCSMTEKKTRHECPVCFRVFSSGQALGGHKRSHVTLQVATTSTLNPVKNPKKLVLSLIDLNLPAPLDDDDEFLMLK